MGIWFHWFMKFFGHNITRPLSIIILVITIGLLDLFYQYIIYDFFLYIYDVYEINMFGIPYNLIILGILFLPTLFPNKKNFNDNTSGVVSLLLLAKKLKEKGINNVKFAFMDNEEEGLFGSYEYKQYLEKNQLIPSHCKIISIDCVGGVEEIPLIVHNSKSDYAE
jgi:hypothetical protein